jgi:hypothetical protein
LLLKLNVTGIEVLHGAGPLPAGQTFAAPKFGSEKLAVTFVAPFVFTLMLQNWLVPALAQAPPQPANV